MDRPVAKVVVNDEGQHALWPAFRENAPGWRDEGFRGSESACLAHIAEVWPDIRPLSERR
ncbi:MbtH family NRPS accessory protein [Amycolatopsis sp. 195334CR]|uniref:MbtH family protein n=1 Tax=Amycolatopsis sp. 195334CR TaxID=2814588 RepID=UPI001A8E3B81|nr:MbtH family NRPS accessory protein [Amycolatopsis sp. 195334CR]MBN6038826.1 MbtH family protein [Amycolatopsis sp. 195334CR]